MCIACNAALSAVLKASSSRRSFLQSMALTSASAALGSWGVVGSPARAQSRMPDGMADTIFRGGPIHTMDRRNPRPQAIAVRGEQILAVGSADDIEARRAPGTRVVDLAGRTLLPGLIDPHMHFVFVQFDDWVDVGPISTPTYAEVLAKLREAVRNSKPGEWVRAQSFDPSITEGAHAPTLIELDGIAQDHPFFMIESNGHVAYANTRALQAAGINRDTPNPPTGRFVRGADGALTGRLEEPPSLEPFLRVMPLASADEMRVRVRRLFDRAASVGCTALHDNGIGLLAGAGDLTLLTSIMQDNPPIRYRGMLVSTAMDEWERMGLKPGHGDDRFRVNGIKAWADGSNQAYTGYQRVDYLNKDTRGVLNYTLPQLTEAIRRAHRGGWQVGVHANGDAAIDTTIDAFQAVLTETPRADHRHRIEHCSMLHPGQIERMVALQLSPSFLIGHVRWWGKAFRDRIFGPERARFYDPCASALAAGLRISLHSDWNVTPIDPLRFIEDATTRIMREGGGVFYPDQRIPVDAALRAVTIDAAWQCRMDDLVGSLEPGKLADLAVLEQDPTVVEPDTISKIKVSETWLGGDQRVPASGGRALQ